MESLNSLDLPLNATLLVALAIAAVIVVMFFGTGNGGGAGKKEKKRRGSKGGSKMMPFEAAGPLFLNKSKRTAALLKSRTFESHDTLKLRFALPTESHVLGLPIGTCIRVFAPNIAKGKETWNGLTPEQDQDKMKQGDAKDGSWTEEIARKYTPTTLDCDVGYFDLVVKIYRGGVLDRFPDGGKMSQYLESIKVGDELQVQGPLGHIQYLGRGKWKYGGSIKSKKNVGMIAGGSGVTPMLQVIQAVIKDKEDTTKLSLLYANKTEEDILVRSML